MPNDLTLSIVIPVLHEEASIDTLIGHVRDLNDGKSPEIIIVDGDPLKSTLKAIRQTGCITTTSGPGRAIQMNAGAALASGDVLLFLHADTVLPENALKLIVSALQDERYAGGAFDLGIATSRKIFRITEKYVAIRTRLTRVPFGDQAIFIRREYFERIGRYGNIPIMEDVELMTRIRKLGGRICIIPEKVMTSARRWEEEGVVRATLRNWMLQLLYLIGVAPERLARFYRS